MLFHFIQFQQGYSLLTVVSLLIVAKTSIFASVMEDKLENKKAIWSAFSFSQKKKKKKRKGKKMRKKARLAAVPGMPSYLTFLTATRYSCQPRSFRYKRS